MLQQLLHKMLQHEVQKDRHAGGAIYLTRQSA